MVQPTHSRPTLAAVDLDLRSPVAEEVAAAVAHAGGSRPADENWRARAKEAGVCTNAGLETIAAVELVVVVGRETINRIAFLVREDNGEEAKGSGLEDARAVGLS